MIKTNIHQINVMLRRAELALVASLAVATSAHVPPPAVAQELGGHEQKGGHVERHEREEPGPHYLSYGATQRTPARTGLF